MTPSFSLEAFEIRTAIQPRRGGTGGGTEETSERVFNKFLCLAAAGNPHCGAQRRTPALADFNKALAQLEFADGNIWKNID